MKSEKIEFLSAVLLASKNPESLAKFYRDVVGLPLEPEQHGESEKHYACELGDLHFAIHPIKKSEETHWGTGAVKLAFTVFDMAAFVARIEKMGFKLAYPPKDMGFALLTALTDPDGNYIEFSQLSDRWFKHLENRRQSGFDIISRWKKTNSNL